MTLLTENEIKKMVKEIFPYCDFTTTYDEIYVFTHENFLLSTQLNKLKGKFKVSWSTKINTDYTQLTLIFKIN